MALRCLSTCTTHSSMSQFFIMSYIKLHRDILDSYSFANAKHLKIWVWLLLKANYKNAYFNINIGKGETTVLVKRGQLIFGRFKAEEELCMDGTFIYRTIQKFKELGQITIKVNSHYSLITICNYESYQGKENESEQAMNRQRSGNEQPMNNTCTTREHIKEELEYKEEKEELIINNTKGSFYKAEQVDPLPEFQIQSIKEQIYILRQQKLETEQILSLFHAFVNENIDGTKFYHSQRDIQKHFSNWIKKQKFNNATTTQPTKTRQQTTNESLEYIREKGEELYRKLYDKKKI